MFGFGERVADRARATGGATGSQISIRFETAAGTDGHECFVPQYLIIVFGLTLNQPYVPVADQLVVQARCLMRKSTLAIRQLQIQSTLCSAHTRCDTCDVRRSNRTPPRVPTGLPAFG